MERRSQLLFPYTKPFYPELKKRMLFSKTPRMKRTSVEIPVAQAIVDDFFGYLNRIVEIGEEEQ